MNPVSHPMPLGSRPMTDVVSPVTPSVQRAANSVQPEIVDSVPVRQPRITASNTTSMLDSYNPISGMRHSSVEPAVTNADDNELVNILKNVNKEVIAKLGPAKKNRRSEVITKFLVSIRKTKGSAPKAKKPGLNMVVIIATAVSAALIILAVFAFRQSQNDETLSRAHLAAVAQAKKVKAENKPAVFGASYLDGFSSSLQIEADAVASNLDFDAASLSDSDLGL